MMGDKNLKQPFEWFSSLENTLAFLRIKLNMYLSCDPEIPLNIYPSEMKTWAQVKPQCKCL